MTDDETRRAQTTTVRELVKRLHEQSYPVADPSLKWLIDNRRHLHDLTRDALSLLDAREAQAACPHTHRTAPPGELAWCLDCHRVIEADGSTTKPRDALEAQPPRLVEALDAIQSPLEIDGPNHMAAVYLARRVLKDQAQPKARAPEPSQERCPHGSFQPTNMNDFCDEHRPRTRRKRAPGDRTKR